MNETVIKKSALEHVKYKKLFVCLFFDMIGFLSFLIPFLGEFTDVIWAPISAFIIAKMFKGSVGKIAGFVSFVEELLPGLDFIPTFTLTWFYTYILKK